MEKDYIGKNDLRALKIMHTALLAGQILFGAVAFFLVYTGRFSSSGKDIEKILQVVVIIFCGAGFYYSKFLFKKKLLLIRESVNDVTEKFEAYRGACILQWALLEGPVLFTLIGFLLSANYAFLILAGVMIGVFYLLSPSKQKIILHLQLNEQEAENL